MATFSVSVVSVVVYKNREKTNSNAETFAWSGSGTKASPYLIDGPYALDQLAENVGNGNTYDGKYFKLTQSFDYYKYDSGTGEISDYFDGIGVKGKLGLSYGNEDCYTQFTFNGHFDGNYNTISGFQIQAPKKSQLHNGEEAEADLMCLGFFASLGKNATVKNLRLKDFSLLVRYQGNEMYGYASDPHMAIGGIAGAHISNGSRASITGCSVEGMRIRKIGGNDKYTALTGGIIGSNGYGVYDNESISIENCSVKDVIIDSSVSTIIQRQLIGVFAGRIKANYGTIKRCVLSGSNDLKLVYASNGTSSVYANGMYWEEGVVGDGVYLEPQSNYHSLIDVGNVAGPITIRELTWYWDNTNVYNVDATKNLSVPVLRGFVDWVECSFSVTNGTYRVTTNHQKVYVPSDLGVTFTQDATTKTKISILNQVINASVNTGVFCHSTTTGWQGTSPTSYKIEFVQQTYNIAFMYDSVLTWKRHLTRESSGDLTALVHSKSFNCCSLVKVIKKGFGDGSNTQENCYKEVEIKIFNVDDGDVFWVKYVADDGYYIDGTSFDNVATSSLSSNITITPVTQVMTYNPNFQ